MPRLKALEVAFPSATGLSWQEDSASNMQCLDSGRWSTVMFVQYEDARHEIVHQARSVRFLGTGNRADTKCLDSGHCPCWTDAADRDDVS